MRIDRPSEPHDFSPVGKIPPFYSNQMQDFMNRCSTYFNKQDYYDADQMLSIIDQDIEGGKNQWFDTDTYNLFKDASSGLKKAIGFSSNPPTDPNPKLFSYYLNELQTLITNNS